jgi:hypothetical protein
VALSRQTTHTQTRCGRGPWRARQDGVQPTPHCPPWMASVTESVTETLPSSCMEGNAGSGEGSLTSGRRSAVCHRLVSGCFVVRVVAPDLESEGNVG